MPHTAVDAALLRVVDETADKLQPLGFVRWGPVLRLLAEGNAAIVSFQKSKYANDEEIEFTINLSVVCGRLLGSDARPLSLAHEVDGHLRERIGFLLDDPDDIWWTIEPWTDGEQLAAEISDLVVTRGVPYLMRYLRTEALIELWASGEAPGVTDLEQDRLLRALIG
jgi:hypothetical protein